MTDRGTKWRFALSATFLMLAMFGLGVRLFFLHLRPDENVRERLKRNRRVEREIIAGRGNIYDCKGEKNILALNLVLKDVCADPCTIVKSDKVGLVASQLAESLGLSSDDLAARLSRPDRHFAYVQRLIHEDKVEEIRQKKLIGVFFRDATVRYYPHKSLMCHVLGFVNYEAVGSAGVEQYLDKYLKGSPGLVESKVDALRRELYWRRDCCIPALKGANVFLNLDQNVQYIVEKVLDEVVVEHHAKGAWAIVERVRTGEILAMASWPVFDLNEFRTAGEKVMLNRAIGYVYEPGSTFKVATIAAALDEGTVSPDTVFHCENGAWLYKGRILRDYHPYGRLTVADVLKKSSNIGVAKVGLTLGDKRLHRYLRAFGIGDKVGVDLPGEEQGILHPVSRWSNISSTRIAIGQGVAVTALQMLGVICAIANEGFLMRPYVLSHASGKEGTILLQTQPEVLARPVSYETSATMRRLLRRVTEKGGTGRRARVDGYEVAGKTGTAQKPVAGGYSSTAHMASFVGFLPAEDPEIAVIVVVDEPQPFHTGGVVAAPAFSKIAGQTVRYLDVPPAQYRIVKR